MQKFYFFACRIWLAASLLFLSSSVQAQGLLLSELFANPVGTDSSKEWIELIATETINFAVTPYSVVVNNNGTATANGWIAGTTISYGYNINTGTVNAGDVVYVGGSQMAVSGPIVRSINNMTTPGDGFGAISATGVFGNGGSNADGIAVFNVPIAAVTPTTTPIDAVFFGTAAGTAVVSGGTAGYKLPVNDRYNGGFLQTNSFIAPDAVSGSYLKATGTFDLILHTFSIARVWENVTTYTNTSAVTLATAPPPASVSFTATHQSVMETVDSAFFQINVANANANPSTVQLELVGGTASSTADLVFSTYTLNIPANGNGLYTVGIDIVNDTEIEQAEYVFFRLANASNANVLGLNQYTLYIKDEDKATPIASNALSLNLLGSYSNGAAGTNSAEISAFDDSTNYIYIANSIGAKLNIIDISNPSAIAPVATISVAAYGNINSVAVKNGLVALAIENAAPQSPGKVVFLDAVGNFLKEVPAGAMPDMVTFNHAGTKVYTTNEGEPNAAYTNDPEGSITVVDMSGGVASATSSNITFSAYNGQEAALRAQGIRIYGVNATAAQDFEPEYITISEDDQTAWVTLQENNAVAKIDLATNAILQLQPLGTKNHSVLGNGLDASDVTNAVNIANWPVKGMYLPDAIEYFEHNGTGYYVTANEGDARAYSGLNEEVRVSAMNLDASAFPNAVQLKNNFALGKLLATNKNGDTDGDGDFDEIHVLGGRSFSIWDATTGAQVYDSGDDFEQITANHPTFGAMFNASNGNSATAKNRSDDKGPEPEGIAIGTIGGNRYAFTALERIGGVMAYDISNPLIPQFAAYANNRSVATNGPDRGAEGIILIPANQSPIGQEILILSNEVSSTLSLYAVCPGGATLQTYYADADGDGFGNPNSTTTMACSAPAGYAQNTLDCDDTNAGINPNATDICSNNIDENCDGADAMLNFVATLTPNCTNQTKNKVVLSGVMGASPITYSKDGGQTFQASPTFLNLTPGIYDFVAAAAGCMGTQTVEIKPTLTLTLETMPILCHGQTASANAIVTNGYPNIAYVWVKNGVDTVGLTSNVTGLGAGAYRVTVVDQYGCQKIAARTFTQPTALTLSVTKKDITCFGLANGQATAKATGGVGTKSYTWSNGTTAAIATNLSAGSYTVTAADQNGCQASMTASINEPAQVQITSISSELLPNGRYKVTVVGTGGTAPLKYQRSLTDTTFQTNLTGVFTNVIAGTYTFKVLDKNACVAEQTQSIPAVLRPAAEQRSEAAETIAPTNHVAFKLTPNPATDFVQLTFETVIPSGGMIELHDMAGRILQQIPTENLSANNNRIDLNSINAKMLLVVLKTADGLIQTRQLVVLQ